MTAPRFVLIASLALASGAPALAQQGPAARQRELTPEQRERLERYRQLSPEQRERLRELYRERLKQASPEERERLRTQARRHRGGHHDHDAGLDDRRRQFHGMPQDKRERYRHFVGGLIASLPEMEQQALHAMDPEARAARVEELIHRHRAQMLERQLQSLPEGQRERFEAALAGLQGPERGQKARDLMRGLMTEQLDAVLAQLPAEQRAELEGLEGRDRFRKTIDLVRRHFGERVRAIREDASLSDAEKQAQLQGLLEALPPMARGRFGPLLRGDHRRGFGPRRGPDGRGDDSREGPWDRGDRPRGRDGERGDRDRDDRGDGERRRERRRRGPGDGGPDGPGRGPRGGDDAADGDGSR